MSLPRHPNSPSRGHYNGPVLRGRTCRATEATLASPAADTPQLAAHLDGLTYFRSTFETGVKALVVRIITPKNTPFDPMLHEGIQIEETDEINGGRFLFFVVPDWRWENG